jgi:DNA-directed RNA polymerase beta' subunit
LPQELPEGLAAYFTRDTEPTTAIPRVVSPEKIREWSHGAVRTIVELESQKIFGPVRSFACECGRFLGAKYRGVVCHRCGVEVIENIVRTYRAGHIELPEPVVHPWHASTIAAILDMGVREAQNANATELRDRLRDASYQLTFTALELRDRKPNDPRLVALEAVNASNVRPEWLVLEMLPVWPPGATVLRDPAAVRDAYVHVLDGVDLRTAVTRLFSTISKQLA